MLGMERMGLNPKWKGKGEEVERDFGGYKYGGAGGGGDLEVKIGHSSLVIIHGTRAVWRLPWKI